MITTFEEILRELHYLGDTSAGMHALRRLAFACREPGQAKSVEADLFRVINDEAFLRRFEEERDV